MSPLRRRRRAVPRTVTAAVRAGLPAARQNDNVIPCSESRRLAERLHGVAPVHLLVTPLLSHADADRPATVIDVLKLAHFWGDLLAR